VIRGWSRRREGDGVVVEGGAAGGRAGVAEERRQHRRAPHEGHRPAQGQRLQLKVVRPRYDGSVWLCCAVPRGMI